jgi:hypothetical protein
VVGGGGEVEKGGDGRERIFLFKKGRYPKVK